jgi:hypothetical protein
MVYCRQVYLVAHLLRGKRDARAFPARAAKHIDHVKFLADFI